MPGRAWRGSSSPKAVAAALARQVADLGIVRVHDHARVGRQVGHGGAPAAGDELELAVAVELVAKQVAEADRARPHAPRDLRQRALVDLEQPQLGVRAPPGGRT